MFIYKFIIYTKIYEKFHVNIPFKHNNIHYVWSYRKTGNIRNRFEEQMTEFETVIRLIIRLKHKPWTRLQYTEEVLNDDTVWLPETAEIVTEFTKYCGNICNNDFGEELKKLKL